MLVLLYIAWRYVCTLGVSPSLVSRYFDGYSLAENANRADSGQLQFWSEPSKICNLRSSNTPETVAFKIPWYLEVWKILNHLMSIVLFRSYHIWNVFYSFLFLPGIYQIHRHLVRRLYFGRNVVKSSDFSWQALSWPVEPHFGHFRVAFKWRFKLYSQWKSTELSPISTFQAKDPLDPIIPQRTRAGKFHK